MTANETVTIDLTQPLIRGAPAWANYVRGVIAGMQRRGRAIPGFDAVIVSNVPLGGGLSSSAALLVSVATLLESFTGQPLDPLDKALLCQRAEQEFAGVPCGIMDQFTSACARENQLLLLDCRSHRAQGVSFADPSVAVLIFNTRVQHQLGDGEYATRRRQCEAAAAALGVSSLRDATSALLVSKERALDPTIFRRARHVVTEITRTVETAEAIGNSDWVRVGQLMYASHCSLRDDFAVSCPELDLVVSVAREIGVDGGIYGCRMTGGGFGGCTVALVNSAKVDGLMNTLTARYRKETGLEPAVFVSRPAGGARIVSFQGQIKSGNS